MLLVVISASVPHGQRTNHLSHTYTTGLCFVKDSERKKNRKRDGEVKKKDLSWGKNNLIPI